MKYLVVRWLGNKWKVCGRKLPWRNVVYIRGFCLEEPKELRRIFGPKRNEITREWRKLHNEELNDLYCSPQYYLGDKIEKNEMGGACSAYGGEENRIQGFGGET
jgi:hypothetical protein